MITRVLEAVLQTDAAAFPVLTLVGPRQSGKFRVVIGFPQWGHWKASTLKTRASCQAQPGVRGAADGCRVSRQA